MERRRGQIIVLAITFIIAIIGLGVAFAAFSTTLNISGSATVQASSWNVYFTKTSKGSAAGTTGVSVTPTATNTQSGINSTASGTGTLKTAEFTWNGTFKTPGDKLSYTFYIYNKGTYTAKLTTLTKPNVTCTKGGNAETTVCGYITYNLYTNSGGTTPLAANSTLAPDACQQVWLIATLGAGLPASSLPDADVVTNPITVTLVYTQV